MKTYAERSELLMKAARLFYSEEWSKTRISHKLGVSVTQVARLLNEARKEGLVRFEFNPPRREDLAAKLKEKYSTLREAIVIGTESNYVIQTRNLAQAAARYFEIHVADGAKVGLSGGLTIFEMVKALPEKPRNIALYPTAILGRGDVILNHVDPIVSLTLLWAKNGFPDHGVSFVTITPAERKGRRLLPRQIYKQMVSAPLLSKAVRRIYRKLRTLDFIFASCREIGWARDDARRTGANAADLLAELGIPHAWWHSQKVIGDFNYSFIDERGRSRAAWKFFLSLQAHDLKEMASDAKRHVVVTGGIRKENILRAALFGRLLNVLITDERTAEKLIASSS